MRIITDYPERLPQLNPVYLGKSTEDKDIRPIELTHVRFHKEYALLTIKGYNDRNKADALRGLMVMIDVDNAVPLEDGEYYLFQLIGMTVKTTDEVTIGTIAEVLETGANDVYVVHGEKFGEILIPAHDETLVSLDFDSGIITMTLPEGLLPTSDTQ